MSRFFLSAEPNGNDAREDADHGSKRRLLPSPSLSLRIVLLLAGITLGVLGYTKAHSSPVVSLGLLAIMTVLVGLAFWRAEEMGGMGEEVRGFGAVWRAITVREHWRAVLLSLAIAQNLGTLLTLQRNENSGWAVVLWLGSIVTLILAVGFEGRVSPKALREAIDSARSKLSPAFALEVALILGLTGLAYLLRAVDLQHYPPMMHGDEGEMGVMALGILEGTFRVPPFTTFWLAHPTMFHYWQALSMALFGKNEVGLRMLSAITGALSVFVLYLLVRAWFGRFAATASAFLLAVSHLHIHFSRLALNNIQSAFLVTLVLLLLTAARRRRSALLYALAGLTGGYSLYFYYGSRIIPPIMLIVLAFLLVERRASLKQVVICILAFWLAFAPLALRYATNRDAFTGRVSGVLAFSEKNFRHVLGSDKREIKDYLAVLRFQVQRTLAFFVRDGDASAFYFRDIPAFDGVTAFLFWLGMGVVLAGATGFGQLSLLCWFWAVVVVGGILTNDPPNAPRLLLAVPAVPIFGGVFLAQARDLLVRLLRVRLDIILVPALLVLAAVTLNLNYDLYFEEYARKSADRSAIEIAREMVRWDGGYKSYLLGDPVLFVEHGVIRFIARDIEKANILRGGPLPSDLGGKGAVFFMLSTNVHRLPEILARYPGGEYHELRDPLGRHVYTEYVVPEGAGSVEKP